MRSVRLLLTAAALAPASAAGCTWFKNHVNNGGNTPRPSGPLAEVAPAKMVDHLTRQSLALQSLEYDDIDVTASGKGMLATAHLRGHLAAAQPRNFRLVGTPKVVEGKVDLGSNPELCWVYLKFPGDPAFFGYASHADFQAGKAQLPGGIKFDPDWVMQALNLTAPPADTGQYSVKKNDRDRTYTLSWPAQGPGGLPVRKEVVFDADTDAPGRPWVKKHLVWDARGNRLIASAEVKSAHTVPGLPAQYPTRVALRWEEQKFEMDLDLRSRPARVNELTATDPARQGEFAHLFQLPEKTYGQTRPIDLARYEFPPAR